MDDDYETWHSRAVEQMQRWSLQKRPLPDYVYGNGSPYIAYLLGIYDGPRGPPFKDSKNFTELVAHHSPDIFKMIAGPNGWAILQTLIARKGLLNVDSPENSSHA